jgi:hypothetical protein
MPRGPVRHLERKLRAKNAARRRLAAEKQAPLPLEKQKERAVENAKARVAEWEALGYAAVTYKDR